MRGKNVLKDLELISAIIDAEFTSVWDGGIKVTTPCKVNLLTREIFDIGEFTVCDGVLNVLDREYVTINGRPYPAVPHDDYQGGSDTECYWYD